MSVHVPERSFYTFITNLFNIIVKRRPGIPKDLYKPNVHVHVVRKSNQNIFLLFLYLCMSVSSDTNVLHACCSDISKSAHIKCTKDASLKIIKTVKYIPCNIYQ